MGHEKLKNINSVSKFKAYARGFSDGLTAAQRGLAEAKKELNSSFKKALKEVEDCEKPEKRGGK